jgi:prephenate dehydrogenase
MTGGWMDDPATTKMTKEQLNAWADAVLEENTQMLKRIEDYREHVERILRLSEQIVERAVRQLRAGR